MANYRSYFTMSMEGDEEAMAIGSNSWCAKEYFHEVSGQKYVCVSRVGVPHRAPARLLLVHSGVKAGAGSFIKPNVRFTDICWKGRAFVCTDAIQTHCLVDGQDLSPN